MAGKNKLKPLAVVEDSLGAKSIYMFSQTLPKISAFHMGVVPQNKYTEPTTSNEQDISQVSFEWIQSLPQKLKDEALLRLLRTAESKPTMVEAFTLIQVLYRTISGGSFTESADNVAARTGCDRKTILKGLAQVTSRNILEKNERPGTSAEYFWEPVEEWKPQTERVVRKTDIRKKEVIESPEIQDTEEVETELQPASNDGVVHITDCPTIWRSNEDGRRYCQIPPIHDQEVGVEIQRQMEQEGLTAQKVVGRAIAFSKVPLMLLETLGNIGRKLVEGFSSVEPESPKSVENKVSTPVAVVKTPSAPVTKTFDADSELEDIEIDELNDVMIQIKLQLRIPVDKQMENTIKRNWKGCTHFNNALTWCVDTAEWLERENKLDRERLFGMLVNAMKNDKKPNTSAKTPEKLENASAYTNMPVTVAQSYSELIQEALSSDDGDFIRMATFKILPLCHENKEFFGFDFVKKCFDVARINPKSILVNSIHGLVKRFGREWRVTINDDGQVVAA